MSESLARLPSRHGTASRSCVLVYDDFYDRIVAACGPA